MKQEILLKQEKIDSMIKFLKRKSQPKSKDLDVLLEHFIYLLDLRKSLVTSIDFTSEDYENTLEYVQNLLDENFESLSKYNYIIK